MNPDNPSGFDAGASQCSWNDANSACAGALYHGQALPLDVYIMFDESGSMATIPGPPSTPRSPPGGSTAA